LFQKETTVAILLVEDDAFKQARIEALLAAIELAPIVLARSVSEAVHRLKEFQYDHVILDIALPSHSTIKGGGASLPMPSGGLEILLELSYEKRADPVTIVTQYPEIEFDGELLELHLAKAFFNQRLGINIREVVYFDASQPTWQNILRNAILQ
jgi:CheY-like chemotaxis protein